MGKRISVPFVKFDSKIPLVEFRAGDVPFVALVDTGSETTMFDVSVADRGNIKRIDTGREMSLVGIGGEVENDRVYALNHEFIMSNQPVDIFGIQTDLSAINNHFRTLYEKDMNVSAIFGSDFLNAYNAIIDFEEQTMHLYM